MPTTHRRIKFFTGAPIAKRLNWDEEILHSQNIPEFDRFLGLVPHPPLSALGTSFANWPKWRRVSIDAPIKTGSECSRRRAELGRANEEISMLAASEMRDEDGEDFLEESFAVYNASAVSQYNDPANTSEDNNLTSILSPGSADNTFLSNLSSNSATSQALLPTVMHLSLPSRITNLSALPKADYLLGISPQTVTVNLVVGVISVAAVRTVRLKRFNSTMDIIEVLVGDETSTGFSINFWLKSEDSQRPAARENPLRNTLHQLRSRDIVALLDIALHVWQGKVYGQSLSQRIHRNESRVNLLGRDGEVDLQTAEDVHDAQSAQLAKVERVACWVTAFLGARTLAVREQTREFTATRAKRKFGAFREAEMPPDTQ